MARQLLTVVASAWLLLGGTEEPLKDTEHLRIVAVQAEPPTAAPGQSVELDLLHSDLVRPATSEDPVPVQVAWIGGCHDFREESADIWLVVRDNRGRVTWDSWTFRVAAEE